jgi:uncharacterized protein with GYD domain
VRGILTGMATYVILSTLASNSFDEPTKFRKIAQRVATEIQQKCPSIVWKQSFATLGRYDVIDIVETDKPEEVARATMIIRSYGHSATETLHATPWQEFLNDLP